MPAFCYGLSHPPPPAWALLKSGDQSTRSLCKQKKITEINDIRDETGLQGLKITIDLKRGADPDRLMQRLYKMTTLQDSFSCNFNILIAGTPRVMGIAEILEEWLGFRTECVKRRLYFDLTKARDKLHILNGLEKILLDIDKAIKIVRETREEAEVVPNLMIGFSIDQKQAEYVAEIKLRHLNREYILKRTEEIVKLRETIAGLEETLGSKAKIRSLIISELKQVAKKYGQPRRTELYFASDEPEQQQTEEIPDYPVTYFYTEQGYFRMSGEQKVKEGDRVVQETPGSNADHLLFFTDHCQVYKSRGADFDDTKASVLGDYIPSKLSFEKDETPLYMAVTNDYSGYMVFVFENGKIAKVEMSAYATKTNRKKLLSAFSDKAPLARALYLKEDCELLLTSSNGRRLAVHTAVIAAKTTKNTQGVSVMTQRKGHRVTGVEIAPPEHPFIGRYRTRSLPAAGKLPAQEEAGEQLTL